MERMDMDTRLEMYRRFRENRLSYFYLAMVLSSFVAFIPGFSDQGFFNLFFYALLAIIIVRVDETRYYNIPIPKWDEILVGLGVCVSSFIFDLGTRGIFGGGYGQTDYTILALGIILLFFGYRNLKKIYLPLLLVGGLSFSLKALQLISAAYFDSIADWFVAAITRLAGPGGLGYPVHSGAMPGWAGSLPGWAPTQYGYALPPNSLLYPEDLVAQPGTFTVFGLNETASLHVDWGCTGLRSLIMFSFILMALIWPMEISGRKKALGIGIGILGAFLINILRMVMLALLMYYKDLDTTMAVHKHLGDFLFIMWIAIYWWVFFHFFGEGEGRESQGEREEGGVDGREVGGVSGREEVGEGGRMDTRVDIEEA
ncbi:MAG: exosortase/archaeosortase family protein [Thermoplasmata archaeon]|nr:exosortase/archaeosortase family protein [Thermoplasmata archaeon]